MAGAEVWVSGAVVGDESLKTTSSTGLFQAGCTRSFSARTTPGQRLPDRELPGGWTRRSERAQAGPGPIPGGQCFRRVAVFPISQQNIDFGLGQRAPLKARSPSRIPVNRWPAWKSCCRTWRAGTLWTRIDRVRRKWEARYISHSGDSTGNIPSPGHHARRACARLGDGPDHVEVARYRPDRFHAACDTATRGTVVEITVVATNSLKPIANVEVSSYPASRLHRGRRRGPPACSTRQILWL